MRMLLLASLISLLGPSPGLGETKAADDRVDELPERYRKWLEEEVTYIISDVERETFLELSTEQEFESFLSAFWRKRDSNPSTLENETQLEHYERLEYVNKFFGRETFNPGWRTDRGRYYILLGPPVERQNYTGYDKIYPSELWFYNDPDLKRFGLPPFFYLLFFQRGGVGEFELFNPTSDEPQDLLTGYQEVGRIFREDIERAYNEIYENVSPELAHATLSFRTDEGDVAQFQAPAFGTMSLLNQVAKAPFVGVDTSYAEYFDAERGLVESDYLFSYVPSWGMVNVLPGPGDAHYVHWVIEVDPQNVALVKDEDSGLYATVFILSAEVIPRGDPEKVLYQERKESFLNLREGQLGNALKQPFSASGMFPVAPGSYDVRVIWRNRACASRDEATCRKGYTLLESAIEVPEWGSGARLSGAILGYGVERPGGDPVHRAYRFGNLELLPNPRRVYAIGDSLTVLCHVSMPSRENAIRLRIHEAAEQELQLERRVPLGAFLAEPVAQELSLQGLNGGRYRLVVELLGKGDEVLDRRVEPFEITPRTAVVRPGVRGQFSSISPEVPGLVEMALGKQYLNLEQKEVGRQHLEASLAANPRLPDVREALASILLEEARPEDALELLAPIRRYMPDRYETQVLVGEALYEKESFEEAVALLEKAATERRLAPGALRALALGHAALGNVERALELVEAHLERAPGQPEMMELLEDLKSRD